MYICEDQIFSCQAQLSKESPWDIKATCGTLKRLTLLDWEMKTLTQTAGGNFCTLAVIMSFLNVFKIVKTTICRLHPRNITPFVKNIFSQLTESLITLNSRQRKSSIHFRTEKPLYFERSSFINKFIYLQELFSHCTLYIYFFHISIPA